MASETSPNHTSHRVVGPLHIGLCKNASIKEGHYGSEGRGIQVHHQGKEAPGGTICWLTWGQVKVENINMGVGDEEDGGDHREIVLIQHEIKKRQS